MGPKRPVTPFLKAGCPYKEAVSPEGGIAVATQERDEEGVTEDQDNEANTDRSARARSVEASLPASSSNGLGHHGELAGPEEGEVREPQEEEIEVEEEHQAGAPAKLVRAPRTPSQSERELHEALHLPHAEWCEYCVRGRGRNKPHKSRKEKRPQRMSKDVTELPWEGQVKDTAEEETSVPKISLDYFFLGADQVRRITRNSADKMSTNVRDHRLALDSNTLLM